MGELIPADVLRALPADSVATLTGHSFFPQLMAAPFKHGLMLAFSFSAVLNALAAAASWWGSVAAPARRGIGQARQGGEAPVRR
jgi:hypothetical protein